MNKEEILTKLSNISAYLTLPSEVDVIVIHNELIEVMEFVGNLHEPKSISDEEIRQDLDILQTNAIEGLEETQNTIDSQKCINNIKQAFINQQEEIKRFKKLLCSDMIYIENNKFQSIIDKIEEVVEEMPTTDVRVIKREIKQIIEEVQNVKN